MSPELVVIVMSLRSFLSESLLNAGNLLPFLLLNIFYFTFKRSTVNVDIVNVHKDA